VKIRILQGHEAPEPVADVHVVIDVLRAFTVSHEALSKGAARIELVATAAEAFERRRADPSVLLVGEEGGYAIDGFDLSNSPVEMAAASVEGRTLVMRTSNGVQAALAARGARRQTLAAAFVDADAVAAHLQRQAADGEIDGVAIIASHPDSDDDLACAEYIRARVLGLAAPDAAEARERIDRSESARKFLDPAQPEFDPQDLAWSTRQTAASFVQLITPGPPTRITRHDLPDTSASHVQRS
jgi:2-phosphosulfolactate phosphatase